MGRAGLGMVDASQPFLLLSAGDLSSVFTQEVKSPLQQRIWFVKLSMMHIFFFFGGV